jgi:hypothetical protein
MKIVCFALVVLALVSCKNQGKMNIEDAKQASIDSMRIEIEKQKVVDSMQVEMSSAAAQKEVVVNQPSNSTTVTEKKGWSGAAKGAVIGSGVGAVTGAIISKKKGEGAIIGGLAGAGVGAGNVAIIDGSKK